jgi:hypothetical protein
MTNLSPANLFLAAALGTAIIVALVSWLRRLKPMPLLILKRVPIGWNQDDFDVLEDGTIVGRIFFLNAVGPQGRHWCGRAATMATSNARRTATKRRAMETRWAGS